MQATTKRRYTTDELDNMVQDQHDRVLWAISDAFALVFGPGASRPLKEAERQAEVTGQAITTELKKYLHLLPEWKRALEEERNCVDPNEDEF
jgi:hypothetical protein